MKRLFSRLGPGAKQALNLTGVNGIFWFAWAFRQLSEYLSAAGGLRPLPAGAPERHRLGGGHRLCGLLGHGQRPAGLGEKGAHRRAGGRRSVLQPGAPHPRRHGLYRAGPYHRPAPHQLLPGLHVHFCRKPAGAQLQRAAPELRPAARSGVHPVHRGQPDHLLPAALCGGGEHLLALRGAHAHPHRLSPSSPGSPAPAPNRRRRRVAACTWGSCSRTGPTCCFWASP